MTMRIHLSLFISWGRRNKNLWKIYFPLWYWQCLCISHTSAGLLERGRCEGGSHHFFGWRHTRKEAVIEFLIIQICVSSEPKKWKRSKKMWTSLCPHHLIQLTSHRLDNIKGAFPGSTRSMTSGNTVSNQNAFPTKDLLWKPTGMKGKLIKKVMTNDSALFLRH